MSEPPDLRAEAVRWLREASEELHAARAVQRDPDSPGRIACFLAHLATEKALKSMLVGQGVPVRRTHDLRELYELLAPESRRKLVSDELRTLNPWAIGGRYTDDLADADEATVTQVLEIAARVVAVAEEALR